MAHYVYNEAGNACLTISPSFCFGDVSSITHVTSTGCKSRLAVFAGMQPTWSEQRLTRQILCPHGEASSKQCGELAVLKTQIPGVYLGGYNHTPALAQSCDINDRGIPVLSC
ncbi:hypothetical protein AAFF_G00112970 [Aldrovandia affinis]|uniref:Uncharacterized protein n=1 Tax=Aldrovandia affinis TaxID=143900 RepID=A0AAD7RT10_9TELE|nr:hypothetical protein AAFF_G00112970 [Aldrovandia affinis]